MLRTLLAVVCAGLLVACSGGEPKTDGSSADIAKVADVKSTFGPGFKVTTVAPTAIDPHLLGPQPLPPGVTFDPADCSKIATASAIPAGVKGNMAATTAEGEGNRFIAIAVDTSEALPVSDPGPGCQRVAYSGPGAKGIIEVTDSPAIEGVHVLGTHRYVQTMVDGKPAGGELYNYVATFGSSLVIVTANPTVQPGKPAATVDTIDTSSLPGDLLNHSTFAQNPVFLNDIEALVRLGRPPAQRAGLRSGQEPGGATYWRLDG
jgi:hypothetical protein